MLHETYLLLALWADPEPFGGSFEGWVQAVEVICSGTCATGLQVNSTLASSAVFIVVDLVLQEKGALGKVNPLRTSLYRAFKASTAADRLLQTRNLIVRRTLTDTEDRDSRYMIATNMNNKWARSKFHKLKQKHKTQLMKHRRESTNTARLWHRNYFTFFFASVLLQHVYPHAWLCPGSELMWKSLLHAQSRRKQARKGFWGSTVPCFMHCLKGQLGKQEAGAQPWAKYPLLWTPLAPFSLAVIVLSDLLWQPFSNKTD